MPNRRVSRLLATAVLLAAPQAARAVIFQSTGDVNFNTTAPTGDYANSGWQYQFNLGGFLGTPVGPHHYLTAAHVGGVGTFTINGEEVIATAVQDYGDLRLVSIDKTFYSYAPLYETSDGDEVGKELVVVGRGVQRGSDLFFDGNLKGWNWGAIDGVRRWGTNVVSSTTTPYGSGIFRYDFDLGASVNEAVVADKDSGGGTFIKVNGQWKVAGITAGVTGKYSDPPSTDKFLAALYNTTGLLTHEFVAAGVASVGPSGSYASRVSSSAVSIKTFLGLPPTWKARFGGTWDTAANWSNLAGGVVPNAVDAVADFRTAIDANQNVTYNGTITVGTMEFDNPGAGYTITPGAVSSSQLHFDVASGEARVNVAAGTHSVGSVYLDDPMRFHIIEPSAKLTLNAFNAQGQAITKTGAGTLQVNRLQAGAVTVSQGTVKIVPGSSPGTGKVTAVSTGAGAKLDLTTTDLIVANTSIGSKSGSTYTGLQGLIQQGSANGAWTGPGITSSSAAATSGLTTLGIASAGDVLAFGGGATTQLWSGQTVTANDALIAYTYAGDANLDGFISGDDYSAIDFNIANPGASGYANGDFNYDGIISGDDYSMIDFNIVAQGADLVTSGSASLSGVSAVPEPASLSLVVFASLAVASRRRRR